MRLPVNHLDLFSGIGGFSLGLEAAGMTTMAFAESNEFARRVLHKHWPQVPIFEDVRNINRESIQEVTGYDRIDIITGGFPCQDISVAGRGAGITGERSGLWSEYKRIIGELEPDWVIIENVRMLLHRGMETVMADLDDLRYNAEWYIIPASRVGAPHRRDRIWIVGYPRSLGDSNNPRLQGLGERLRGARQRAPWQEGKAFRGKDQTVRLCAPGIPLMADGLPETMERLQSTGNAIVPQIAEAIGQEIAAYAIANR